jgi:hypothetical protein
MDPDDPTPPETKAQVLTGFFFESLRQGDYIGAARAQEDLRRLGWNLDRTTARKTRLRREVAK